MQFKITLKAIQQNSIIPINYQYPISAALYRIIANGDQEYADLLPIKNQKLALQSFP